ncbi:unnamed protein product [Bursaphelenchus okinawaensis]|uniref:Synembryn n=1 Tax=Bursaphelenchus okinawaensis TaxID=465554 RepID=A0A811L1B2_9BILA|nr:unnamed protein product [Bursaphelenchus okinawaensis]CAG9115140.1 unnamed protein product [Bursaphelenchus okinawaensis]
MVLDANVLSHLKSDAIGDAQLSQLLLSEFGTYLTSPAVPHMDPQAKTVFSEVMPERYQRGSNELKLMILRAYRVLLRDTDNIGYLMTTNIPYFIISAAGLNEEGKAVDNFDVVMEGCKCMVNGTRQSEELRRAMISEDCAYVGNLAERIITSCLQIFNPTVEQPIFVHHDVGTIIELLYLDLRVIFAITALSTEARTKVSPQITFFIGVIHKFALQLTTPSPHNSMKQECITELLKVLFNVFIGHVQVDQSVEKLCAQECSQLIKSNYLPNSIKYDAVNVLAHISSQFTSLCPQVTEESVTDDMIVYEGMDVTFLKCLLDLLELRLDELSAPEMDLLITYFGILTVLCKENKAARRYCRQRILPPLRANDVEHPPEEGMAFRNKIIRIMTKSVGTLKRIVAEFLFVLCKRSVSRMIKYCGFGHSAGLLADYGFLSKIGEVRRASDSEDSETEDYKQVEPSVNPVTGYVQGDRRNPFDYMTEEQKEYEAVKLANTMDKLLDSGVFMPGRIGPDGRPQAVSHVNELVKDVHIESDHSDED